MFKKNETRKMNKKLQNKNMKKSNKRKSVKNMKKSIRTGGAEEPISEPETPNTAENVNRDPKTTKIDEKSISEAESYMKLIDAYLERQTPPYSVRYMLTKTKFDEYSEKKKNLANIADMTLEDLYFLKGLVFFIIQFDKNKEELKYDKNAASFQTLLNNVMLYFVNEKETEDDITLNVRKRKHNGIPYLEVIHKKSGLETTYDVNEVFALLKSHMKNSESFGKSDLLKTITLKNKRGVETKEPLPSAPMQEEVADEN